MGGTFYSKRLKEREAPKRRPRVRPKTFKTTEAAEAWAKEQKLKKYHLKDLRLHEGQPSKIQVIVE